jgi:predicted metalloendopeptidase
MEKKRVLYWGEQVGVTFNKKTISREAKKRMQEKVDRLEIIKGFPKIVWQFCTFTPEEYEKKKKKLKIETDRNEIFIPKLFMKESGKRFDDLYGAYCMFECKFE